MLTFYQEFLRNKKRLENSIKEISTCAISGAVGTFANIDPRVETFVAKKLNYSEIKRILNNINNCSIEKWNQKYFYLTNQSFQPLKVLKNQLFYLA